MDKILLESGLVSMHFIWVPTDDDPQQYPHALLTSPVIWDASVLDHGITPALLDEIAPGLFSMNLETFNNQWYSTWMFSGIQSQERLGSILFILIFMRVILLNKTEIAKALLWLAI